MKQRRGNTGPPSRSAPRVDLRIPLLGLLVVAVAGDVFRLSWFADDFHFLDIARRVPLWQSLSGQFGLYPWYRPLSRELYFALIVAAGPLGRVFAHATRLACLAGSAWALLRIGRRLLDPRLAPIAPALFVSYAFTKFLAGWSAGFQDLLALFLVLIAIADFADGRIARSRVWLALAPFAKEVGFVALPLMIAFEWLCRPERRWRAWLPWHLVSWCAAIAVHVAVRMTWKTGGTAARIEQNGTGMLRAFGDVLGGFVGRVPVLEPWPMAAGIAAGAIVAVLLARFRDGASDARGPGDAADSAQRPETRRTLTFLFVSMVLGVSPMVVAQLARLTQPHPYYAIPAIPWLALAIAMALGRMPTRLWRVIVPALVGWNAWCLGFVAPDLDSPAAWRFHRWDWHEAVRLSEVSKRMSADVREALASRPDSLVVLYNDIPFGCMFQTEDGPATRESLADRTVRAYFVHSLPFRTDRKHLAIVTFDRTQLHLVAPRLTFSGALEASTNGVMCGSGWPAYAYASMSDTTGGARFALRYVCAAARLIEEGPHAFLDGQREAGVVDTVGPSPDNCAYAMIPKTVPLSGGLAGALRHPLSAAAHSAYGDQLAAREFGVSAAVEYRIAVTLDPTRARDRLQLATWIAQARLFDDVARAELDRVMRDAPGSPTAEEARRLLASISTESRMAEARN